MRQKSNVRSLDSQKYTTPTKMPLRANCLPRFSSPFIRAYELLSDKNSRREVDKKLQVKFDGQRFSGNDFFARKSKVRQDFESAFQYKKDSAGSNQEEIFVDLENFFPSYKENSKCPLIRHQGRGPTTQYHDHFRGNG